MIILIMKEYNLILMMLNKLKLILINNPKKVYNIKYNKK